MIITFSATIQQIGRKRVHIRVWDYANNFDELHRFKLYTVD